MDNVVFKRDIDDDNNSERLCITFLTGSTIHRMSQESGKTHRKKNRKAYKPGKKARWKYSLKMQIGRFR